MCAKWTDRPRVYRYRSDTCCETLAVATDNIKSIKPSTRFFDNVQICRLEQTVSNQIDSELHLVISTEYSVLYRRFDSPASPLGKAS